MFTMYPEKYQINPNWQQGQEKYLLNPDWVDQQNRQLAYQNYLRSVPGGGGFAQSYDDWSWARFGPTPAQLYQKMMSNVPWFVADTQPSFEKWYNQRASSLGASAPYKPLGTDWQSKLVKSYFAPPPGSDGLASKTNYPTDSSGYQGAMAPQSQWSVQNYQGAMAPQSQWSVQKVEEKVDPAASESYWSKQRTAFQNLMSAITPSANSAFRDAFMAIPEETRAANPLLQVLAAKFGPTTGV